MNPTYEGPITVHLDDGHAIEGHARLEAHEERDAADGRVLMSWDGRITFANLRAAQTVFEQRDLDLIMPDGTPGSAVASSVTFPEPVVEIQGTGPAPWDTGL